MTAKPGDKIIHKECRRVQQHSLQPLCELDESRKIIHTEEIMNWFVNERGHLKFLCIREEKARTPTSVEMH